MIYDIIYARHISGPLIWRIASYMIYIYIVDDIYIYVYIYVANMGPWISLYYGLMNSMLLVGMLRANRIWA